MKALIRFATLVLLLVNGFGALYGGWLFITDPSGGSLQVPLSWLDNTPFPNYLIPGIILLSVNGVYNLVTAAFVLLKRKHYPWFTMVAGAMLMGWIAIQIYIIQTFYPPLHLSFFGIGFALFGCGFLLYRVEKGKLRYAAM